MKTFDEILEMINNPKGMWGQLTVNELLNIRDNLYLSRSSGKITEDEFDFLYALTNMEYELTR